MHSYKQVLKELAKSANSIPLPQIRESSALRLPPAQHCLVSDNYQVDLLNKEEEVNGMVEGGSNMDVDNDKGKYNVSVVEHAKKKKKIVDLGNVQVNME